MQLWVISAVCPMISDSVTTALHKSLKCRFSLQLSCNFESSKSSVAYVKFLCPLLRRKEHAFEPGPRSQQVNKRLKTMLKKSWANQETRAGRLSSGPLITDVGPQKPPCLVTIYEPQGKIWLSLTMGGTLEKHRTEKDGITFGLLVGVPFEADMQYSSQWLSGLEEQNRGQHEIIENLTTSSGTLLTVVSLATPRSNTMSLPGGNEFVLSRPYNVRMPRNSDVSVRIVTGRKRVLGGWREEQPTRIRSTEDLWMHKTHHNI